MELEHRLRSTIDLWSPGFSGFGGGITAFSRELARALAANGHGLRLLGKADPGAGQWAGLPLQGAGAVPARLRTAAFAVQVWAAACSRPDWIVSTHVNFGPAARWAKRTAKVPYALVAHGIDVDPAMSPARLAALRDADSLIAVSGWTRDRLLALKGIEEAKIRILPNTYDGERFRIAENPAELRSRYGIGAAEKVILTVARLDPGEGYKGYDRVLAALPTVIEACGPVRYVIAGKGGDRERLEAMARELGMAGQIVFAGFVPDDELGDHYRLADVFAMPSTGEGFGIVFLEAMACGTPVLGGNQDGSVDALDHGRLGKLVDPGSVEAVAGGLIGLLQRQGPSMWFDRQELSDEVNARFGREAFRKRVQGLF